ncbi:MAG: hypothetical protein IPL61_04275 [Myxococcales bacterium]|nr:hypothetical protein [Myxococcales bacterium]
MRPAAVAALALALAGCGGAPAPARPLGPPLDARLAALDGGELGLAELRGQIVVIHVFTTWSLAADLERDALAAADARPDVTVIGLALDPEGYPLVAPWRAATAVPYLIALGDDATRAGGGPLGRITQVPMTIVLDRAGRVTDRLDHQLSPAELDAAIARAQ